jgi:hypothetical protein
MMSDYYQRQTCLNGHIISNYIGASFGTPQNHCSKCGAKTIVECPNCNLPQHGSPRDFAGMGAETPDAYCWNCGVPFPWTQRQIEATVELVNEEELLSEEDKKILASSLSDLASDTPKTALAATRFKRIVSKVGGSFRAAMYKFIVDFSSETAKKIVLGE